MPFLIFLLFANLSLANAGSGLTRPAEDCACDPSDHFDQGIRFDFGSFKNLCVDSCRFRRPHILRRAKVITVANVLHDGKFWTAEIPVKEITEADIEFENFLSVISHVFLRFRFPESSPVQLHSQGKINETRQIYDLLISAEGVPPKGHPYAFLESSKDQYLLTYRVLSVSEAYNWMVGRLGHSVKQFHLHLDGDTRERLLLNGLTLAMNDSFESVYHLFTNNCATSAMTLIEGAAAAQPKAIDWFFLNSLERAIPMDAPLGTRRVLEKKGLISTAEAMPNLETEFREALPCQQSSSHDEERCEWKTGGKPGASSTTH